VTFHDHFSPVAVKYASFRPDYPQALFDYLAGECRQHELVWDCACGSGQASVPLAAHFAQVIATDASAEQLAAARPHPRVSYRHAPAEASDLGTASADLITVAQALHWFNVERFYAEATRVLKPGGLLAVWTYGAVHVEDPDAQALLQTYSEETVGPYWPPERRFVDSGYSTLPFPFAELEAPEFDIEQHWDRTRLTGYLRTWSSTSRFVAKHHVDPVIQVEEELTGYWPHAAEERRIAWPISMRLGRRP